MMKQGKRRLCADNKPCYVVCIGLDAHEPRIFGLGQGLVPVPVGSMQKRAKVKTQTSARASETSLECMDLFQTTAREIGFGCAADQTDIDHLCYLLAQSRTASDLIEKTGVTLVVDAQERGVSYHAHTNQIALSNTLTEYETLYLAARGLRRAAQIQKGLRPHPVGFDPDDSILLARAVQADEHVYATRILWDLKLAGHRSLWEDFAASANGDMALAFAQEAGRDFRAIHTGLAQRSVYEAWFASGRVKDCDRATIQDMLADPFGTLFAKDGEPVMLKRLDECFMAGLGADSRTKNYLMMSHVRPALDRSYAQIEDRSNANIFWFVKFELELGEAEQQLAQPKFGPKSATEIAQDAKDYGEVIDLRTARLTVRTRTYADVQTSAEIVAFPQSNGADYIQPSRADLEL